MRKPPISFGELAFESKERAGDISGSNLQVYGVDRSTGLTSEAKYASEDLVRYKVIRPGMFAYNPMRLNIGSIAYCSNSNPPGLVSPDYVVFGCNPGILDADFASYLIKGPEWRRWTTAAGVGSVRTRIYFRELARMPLNIPPFAEQRAIAEVLGALDDKIELNRRMNATLEAMARALFQNWFVDFDPVHAKLDGRAPVGLDATTAGLFPSSFQDSCNGPIPKGWSVTTLGETCERGGGNIQTGPFGTQLHASDYVAEGVPSIMPANLRDNRIDCSSIAMISEQDAERLKVYRVRPGDIVYSRRGDVERRSLIRSEEDGWLCGTGCLRVRFGLRGLNPLFGAAYLGTAESRAWVVRHAVGATMPNLNTSILAALPIINPPAELQSRFAEIVGPWDDCGTNALKQALTLSALRDTLLPKLLSEELSVSNASREVRV